MTTLTTAETPSADLMRARRGEPHALRSETTPSTTAPAKPSQFAGMLASKTRPPSTSRPTAWSANVDERGEQHGRQVDARRERCRADPLEDAGLPPHDEHDGQAAERRVGGAVPEEPGEQDVDRGTPSMSSP